ncbi:metallophosphoesterase [Halobacillus massiliensis]|uniref:metallophosphoesterase n=1 Tax=Halobacillus massiliensis TaxID=1926286 RepID=UPI0009E59307|nr:metallophosphoesterase [Halobacillus massiliensis]
MKKRLVVFTGIAVAVASFIKSIFDTKIIKINRLQLQSSKLPKAANLNIMQISDLHNKEFGKGNKQLIAKVNELNPDIIVITGDLINRQTKYFHKVFSFIEQITDKHAVYFVTGNHEWENPVKDVFLNGLKARNVVILNNENMNFTKANTVLNIVGVDDVSTENENIEKAFNGLTKDRYTLLLSHAPDVALIYNDLPADLILSGHTHGGQIRLPFIGALTAPGQGFFPKYDKGIFSISEGQKLHIDSGLGTVHIPVRFFNQSQVSFIQLVNPDNRQQ